MRIGVARNDKQGTQPPLRRCLRHFFPRHDGDSDTCQPCRCRVAPRPVLKETRERSGATETRDRGRGSRATRTERVRERVYERGEKRMISRHLPRDGPGRCCLGPAWPTTLESPPPDREELPNWSEIKLRQSLKRHRYASNVNLRELAILFVLRVAPRKKVRSYTVGSLVITMNVPDSFEVNQYVF